MWSLGFKSRCVCVYVIVCDGEIKWVYVIVCNGEIVCVCVCVCVCTWNR